VGVTASGGKVFDDLFELAVEAGAADVLDTIDADDSPIWEVSGRIGDGTIMILDFWWFPLTS
jgi:hypothetical protein